MWDNRNELAILAPVKDVDLAALRDIGLIRDWISFPKFYLMELQPDVKAYHFRVGSRSVTRTVP